MVLPVLGERSCRLLDRRLPLRLLQAFAGSRRPKLATLSSTWSVSFTQSLDWEKMSGWRLGRSKLQAFRITLSMQRRQWVFAAAMCLGLIASGTAYSFPNNRVLHVGL